MGGGSFVLRITGADSELLGIDRNHEFAANLAAGKMGLAPEVYHLIQPEGYLVTRFINGRSIPPEEITQPENIHLVMEKVLKVHRMEPIPGCFDPFQAIRDYTAIARLHHLAFPDNYDRLIGRMDQAEVIFRRRRYALAACHNDLLNANFLLGSDLFILDWEYAGMGDEFFDLANFSDHHNLSDEQDRWLLKCYFGDDLDPDYWAHLKIMKVVSELREATWGLVQVIISNLDFDFRAYADKFFGRVINNIHTSHWNEWLKEVSKNV